MIVLRAAASSVEARHEQAIAPSAMDSLEHSPSRSQTKTRAGNVTLLSTFLD
ncbi:MAG TPA: hypothetical protein V6C90_26765 [Coleofasciculaceae cyanobacterium]